MVVLMQAWAWQGCALCRNAGICIKRLVGIFCLKSDYEMTMMKITRKIIEFFILIIFDIHSGHTGTLLAYWQAHCTLHWHKLIHWWVRQ